MDALKAMVDKNKSLRLMRQSRSSKNWHGKVRCFGRSMPSWGLTQSKGEQQIRATAALPHGTGRSKTIAAFVGSDDEKAAKEAGADFVYGEADIKKSKTAAKLNLRLPLPLPMMPKLAVAATFIQRGLAPNPKTDTVGKDIKNSLPNSKRQGGVQK